MTDDSHATDDNPERLSLFKRLRTAWPILRDKETVFQAVIR